MKIKQVNTNGAFNHEKMSESFNDAGIDLDLVWRKVEEVVSNVFPDGDPIDYLVPWLKKYGITDFKVGDVLDAAAKKNGYDDIYAYYDSMNDLSETNVHEGSFEDTLKAMDTARSADPTIGDTIRTKKMSMEGRIERIGRSKAGYDEVFFRTADNRLMKTPISNVTVIEKLADEQINEISNEVLSKYKTAASQSAKDSDKKGDYATGNKRFSGIVKATKKQFANDAKARTQETLKFSPGSFPDVDHMHGAVYRNGNASLISNKKQFIDKSQWEAEANKLNSDIYDDMSDIISNKMGAAYRAPNGKVWARWVNGKSMGFVDLTPMAENGMTGINRSAPSTDVSYEKVLDEEPVNELNLSTLQNFQNKIKSPERARTASLYQLSKDAEGASRATNRIRTKTGDRTQRQDTYKTYEERLSEYVKMYEDKQIVNIGKTKTGKPGLFAGGFMAIPLTPEEYNRGIEDRDYLENLAAKYGFILRQDTIDEDKKEDIERMFKDILGKQDLEQKAAKPKGKISSIPYHGWEIRYRNAVTPGERINWKIFDKKGDERHSGSSVDDKEAVRAAEDWINSGGGTKQQATKKVTIDFNVDFAREFAPNGETFYMMFDNNGSIPMIYLSTEPQSGFKKSAIRTQSDKATGTTTLLPSASMSPGESNSVGFQPNGRYILGAKDVIDNDTVAFPLIYQSTSQSKTDTVRLGKPGLTVATSREIDEVYAGPWKGDEQKIVKSPKTSMQGVGNVRFSDMVKDTINTHGLKWAFDFYVNKHGLPPRQFQIFAGLTVGSPKTNSSEKPAIQRQLADPVVKKEPEKQSWWKKLRGKLPFEE